MKKKVDGNFTLSVKEIPEVFPSWWWMGSAGARLEHTQRKACLGATEHAQGKAAQGRSTHAHIPHFGSS